MNYSLTIFVEEDYCHNSSAIWDLQFTNVGHLIDFNLKTNDFFFEKINSKQEKFCYNYNCPKSGQRTTNHIYQYFPNIRVMADISQKVHLLIFTNE